MRRTVRGSLQAKEIRPLSSQLNESMQGMSLDALIESVNKEEMEKEENNEKMAPIFVFLASSLNVELVYIILYGITTFTQLKDDMFGITYNPTGSQVA